MRESASACGSVHNPTVRRQFAAAAFAVLLGLTLVGQAQDNQPPTDSPVLLRSVEMRFPPRNVARRGLRHLHSPGGLSGLRQPTQPESVGAV